MYLMARVIQFFTPGIPMIYYIGLLAGENDLQVPPPPPHIPRSPIEAERCCQARLRQSFDSHICITYYFPSSSIVKQLHRLQPSTVEQFLSLDCFHATRPVHAGDAGLLGQ